MFILSQDKKKLAKYKSFRVSKNYRGREKSKCFLLGIDCCGITGRTIVLGSYDGEEEAIAELKNICSAMRNGKTAYAVK
ncbi:MAG: hypothetical protein ACI4RM_06035 [Ruminococcus sp.]